MPVFKPYFQPSQPDSLAEPRSTTVLVPTSNSFDTPSAECNIRMLQSAPLPNNAGCIVDQEHLKEFLQNLAVKPSIPDWQDQQRVVFHFLRHAQGSHNIKDVEGAVKTPKLTVTDPNLTSEGIRQCQIFQTKFPNMDKIACIVSSPMTRTLETALVSLAPVFTKGLQVVVWEDLREFGSGKCSTGKNIATLKEEFKGLPINWNLLQDGWEYNEKSCKGTEARKESRLARENRVRTEIYSLAKVVLFGGVWNGIHFPKFTGVGKVEIAVVSHGAFLSEMLGFKEQVFHNMECKTFAFATKKDVNNGSRERDLVQLKDRMCYHLPPHLTPPGLESDQIKSGSAIDAMTRGYLMKYLNNAIKSAEATELNG